MKRALMLLSALSLAGASAAAVAVGGNADAGEETARAQCASCHGVDGNSPTGQFPKLAGQYATYIIKALEDYKSGARVNPLMAGVAANLSDQDRQDLAAYFSNQTGLSTVPR